MDAKKELADLKAMVARSEAGLGVSPFVPVQEKTVAAICDFYLAAGCPKRKGKPREGKQLAEEIRRVENVKRHIGERNVERLSAEDCDDYAKARKLEIQRKKKFEGDRAIDLELAAFSGALRHARRNPKKTGVRINPLADRPRYRDSAEVVHCRDLQPRNGDELHRLARFFFDTEESEALGWELLFQALTGLRTAELLQFRMDAQTEEQAGFVRDGILFFPVSRTHKGVAQFIRIHPALSDCLKAHRQWHLDRFSGSPWFFPGRDPAAHVDEGALAHALKRACKLLKLPHRTPHGLRSFHVNCLRSQGIADSEIALRIGHKSGGKLIVEVYGEYRAQQLDWMPADPEKNPPAWNMFAAGDGKIIELSSAAI